ncbi:hypothetical protein SAMN04487916_101418 [Arthrobacter sp. ov407]|uniref:hypothetical protein n=1 Tax=Arthrobacter sp. ov407 TaxID=1761748 RepID=UPI00088FCC79|nr:hypothetical protein [Arthrobacter sp. ov407]SDK54683.1 hypothetical protein SAMN04487916_101418 [Arthrobacter sp. ov407]
MRTFVSAAAVLVGLLMAAVAVPAMWVDRNIVQEEGFVALTAPLGKDPAFQQRLATAAVDGLASSAGIPQALTELARPVLDNVAQSLTGLPGYSEAWAETLRKSHRLTFADPSTLPPEVDGTSSLTLDVAPLVGLVAKQVSDATTLPLEAPGQVLIHIGQSDQRQLIERVTVYAPMGYAVAVGAGIAFVLAFVAARRRWTVLVGMGVGALVLAGAWKLTGDAAGAAVAGTSSGNDVAELFKNEFVAACSDSFGQWILAAAVAGAALLATGVAVRVAGGRNRGKIEHR